MRILPYASRIRKSHVEPDDAAADAAVAAFISYGVMAMLWGLWLLVIAAAVHCAPSNHWNYDIRCCLLAAPIAAVWLIVAWAYGWIPKSLRLALLLTIIVFVVTICAVDRFNLLVNYDELTARGMPARWEMR